MGEGEGEGGWFLGGGEMWDEWRVGVGVGLRDWVRWLMLDCSGLYDQVIYSADAAKRCNKWHIHRVLVLLSQSYPHDVRSRSVE